MSRGTEVKGPCHVPARAAQWRRDGKARAADVIGPLEPGSRVVGLTYGQFGALELLVHVLSCTGPADVDIVTWRIGDEDAEQVAWLRDHGEQTIRRLRLILGSGVVAGKRERWIQRLAYSFGPDEIRLARVHAKWFTVTNEAWAVCVRSSMNVNRNTRWEQFDLDVDPDITGWFRGVVDDVFRGAPIPGMAESEGSPARLKWDAELAARTDRAVFGELATEQRSVVRALKVQKPSALRGNVGGSLLRGAVAPRPVDDGPEHEVSPAAPEGLGADGPDRRAGLEDSQGRGGLRAVAELARLMGDTGGEA